MIGSFLSLQTVVSHADNFSLSFHHHTFFYFHRPPLISSLLQSGSCEIDNTSVGALAWSLQLAPQAVKSYKRRDTAGLSTWMLGIWLLSASFLGAFLIVQKLSIPLIIQPQAFAILAAICWSQCLRYNSGWSKRGSILFAIGSLMVFAVLEVEMVFISLRVSDKATTAWVSHCLINVRCAELISKDRESCRPFSLRVDSCPNT